MSTEYADLLGARYVTDDDNGYHQCGELFVNLNEAELNQFLAWQGENGYILLMNHLAALRRAVDAAWKAKQV